MGGNLVSDIVKGEIDMAGSIIETVFCKVSEIYAIYATQERVVVHFADEPMLGSEQRLALAPLAAVRGEINGLIDGWRAAWGLNANRKKYKARRYDRRTADALSVALQGDQARAEELLRATKADILEERTSIGRTEYLITAVVLSVAMLLLLLRLPPVIGSPIGDLWFAGVVGCFGALFSIALAIRSREVHTDLKRRDNVVDAGLRVLIGAISAVILISLFKSELVALKLGNGNVAATSQPALYVMIVIAFLAGFSERLVGDFLGTAVLAGFGQAADTAKAAPAAKPIPEAHERNPRGTGLVTVSRDAPTIQREHVHYDDGVDHCVCDVPLQPEDVTEDADLPAASGGIARAA